MLNEGFNNREAQNKNLLYKLLRIISISDQKNTSWSQEFL